MAYCRRRVSGLVGGEGAGEAVERAMVADVEEARVVVEDDGELAAVEEPRVVEDVRVDMGVVVVAGRREERSMSSLAVEEVEQGESDCLGWRSTFFQNDRHGNASANERRGGGGPSVPTDIGRSMSTSMQSVPTHDRECRLGRSGDGRAGLYGLAGGEADRCRLKTLAVHRLSLCGAFLA